MNKILSDKRAFEVLSALEMNPTGSIQEIVTLTNLSHQTVTSKLKIMKEKNFFFDVRSILSLKSLELWQIDVLVDTPNTFSTKLLEIFMDNHHYASYRSRITGKNSGLYCQFRIPKAGIKHLITSFNEFKALGFIINFIIFQTSDDPIFTKLNSKFWNTDSLIWDFNWDIWKKYDKLIQSSEHTQERRSIISNLDRIDAYLLYWLTFDARVKQTELIETIKMDGFGNWKPNSISRRITYLKKSAIIDYSVNLNWEMLNIYNPIFLMVKCHNSVIKWIFSFLNTANTCPPFNSQLIPLKEGFNWILNYPSGHFKQLLAILWDKITIIRANILDIKNSRIYPLDFNSFITDTWNVKEDFVHEYPFDEALQSFNIIPEQERVKQIF